MIFWIFWRCYEGVIDGDRFTHQFHKAMKKEFFLLFTLLKNLGLGKEEEERVLLTERGRYLYHVVEKQYSLQYLNPLWASSVKEAWIKEMKL